MRFISVSTAAALTVLCVSTSLMGQRPDDQIDVRSVALLQRGEAAKAANRLDEAAGLIETALAVDPRNRAAFIALAEVAEARDLNGKAIRLYREALLLDPNDVKALGGQGEAMVLKGAVNSARENLVKIKTICAQKTCPEATQLAAVIAKGPPVTQTAAAKPETAPEAAKPK